MKMKAALLPPPGLMPGESLGSLVAVTTHQLLHVRQVQIYRHGILGHLDYVLVTHDAAMQKRSRGRRYLTIEDAARVAQHLEDRHLNVLARAWQPQLPELNAPDAWL